MYSPTCCPRRELRRISRVDVVFPARLFVYSSSSGIARLQILSVFLLNIFFPFPFLRPPGACLITKTPSNFQEERDVLLAPGVGFEPTRLEGHRLTGEPIPDMGPRDTQTARYQAPEPRLNEKTFERLFSLLGSHSPCLLFLRIE